MPMSSSGLRLCPHKAAFGGSNPPIGTIKRFFMSLIMLVLVLLAVGGGGGILYGGYRLYRSAELDDEIAERKRLEEEAKRLEEIEKLFPGATATANQEKKKRFVRRT
jgi:hypothetical protein